MFEEEYNSKLRSAEEGFLQGNYCHKLPSWLFLCAKNQEPRISGDS